MKKLTTILFLLIFFPLGTIISQEISKTEQIKAAKTVSDFCEELISYSKGSAESRILVESLIEMRSNGVYNDIDRSGMVELSEYLNLVLRKKPTIRFSEIPTKDKWQLAKREDGWYALVIPVKKQVNRNSVVNYFFVNPKSNKVVNIYNKLPGFLTYTAINQRINNNKTQDINNKEEADIQQIITEANRCLENNQYNEALVYVNKIIEKYPDEETYYYIKGSVLQKLKKYEEAIGFYKKACEIKSDYFDAIISIANIYLELKKYDEAINFYKKAFEIKPDRFDVIYSAGAIYHQLERNDESISCYKKAYEIKPDYFDAIYNIGVIYLNNGVDISTQANDLPISKQKEYDASIKKANAEFKESLPYFERAHELNPKDISTMEALKQLYFRFHESDKKKDIEAKLNAIR